VFLDNFGINMSVYLPFHDHHTFVPCLSSPFRSSSLLLYHKSHILRYSITLNQNNRKEHPTSDFHRPHTMTSISLAPTYSKQYHSPSHKARMHVIASHARTPLPTTRYSRPLVQNFIRTITALTCISQRLCCICFLRWHRYKAIQALLSSGGLGWFLQLSSRASHR
jgi:hypothetical protein